MAQQCDPRSDGPHLSKNDPMAQNCETNRKTRVDFPKIISTKSYYNNHLRESSIEPCESDDGHNMYNLEQSINI